jgi:release factor glutamine methyltransferase
LTIITMTEWHPLPSKDSAPSPLFQELNSKAENRAVSCESASMPSLDHLKMKDYEEVYEPSDDTFLLIDGLQLALKEGEICIDKTHTTLEIGCGTGVPTVFLARQIVGAASCLHIVTDINPRALHVAKATAAANGVPSLEAIECDLASALLPRWEHGVDVLIFNPPYVPTPNDEVGGNGIEASWAGGLNGRVVIDRAIPQIAKLLSKPRGVGFMITVDDNLPEDLQKQFHSLALRMEPWVRRRARNEYLTVQKISWIENEHDKR